ncbi:6-carboxytetrahydropterin synthase [Salinadaptatus halalkaliphilus]|uniref:6-carboxytetrahydropterin synthase n=1 Tax=Salinadaptatus halalkaliphilus TaxID=2419781 RepID=A0A4S3TMN9_9EURY|nr:6-carboxytetrahydropterin synthase [Salinadaptatus halalkaliphilus]THE65416.1 6-carboxytetrahydropterin synthase [Salinadaptatus halalkaliphilus]
MYTVSVSDAFVAQHYLTVPDAGPEGQLHSHRYTATATFRGPELGPDGYLVDIDAVTDALESVVDSIRDRTLNELPALEELNPSAERVATLLGDRLVATLTPELATELGIRLCEDDVATVSHERSL